mmetsp:Transcript_425/g.1212  ORF Transcript_425/g.1212 Transcript_425/m.1212 type:complete len:218 (+) Transcript_425:73-726(+)
MAPWKVSLGFMDVSSEKGLELKPQFRVGLNTTNFQAGAGVGDVRDGLSASIGAGVMAHGSSNGKNFREVINNIKMETDVPGLGEFITELTKFLITNQGKLFEMFAQQLGVNLKPVVESGRTAMHMKLEASTGVGMGGKLALGWKNVDGFHMVGASGFATMGLTAGASGFIGAHNTEPRAKIIFSFGNFASEIIVVYKDMDTLPAAEGSAAMGAPAAM